MWNLGKSPFLYLTKTRLYSHVGYSCDIYDHVRTYMVGLETEYELISDHSNKFYQFPVISPYRTTSRIRASPLLISVIYDSAYCIMYT